MLKEIRLCHAIIIKVLITFNLKVLQVLAGRDGERLGQLFECTRQQLVGGQVLALGRILRIVQVLIDTVGKRVAQMLRSAEPQHSYKQQKIQQ